MAFKLPAKNRKSRQTAIGRNVRDLDLTSMVDNLLAVYDSADDDAIAEGENWYPNAHEFARMLTNISSTPISHYQACGIVAALSPNTKWSRNQTLAVDLVETGDCMHLSGDCIRKARAILEGADWFDVLGGRKVRSFAANVWRPWTHGATTNDRHIVDAALGRKTDDATRKLLERIGNYVMVSAALRAAARRRNRTALVFQAIVWVRWRQLHTYNGGDF